MKKAHPRVGPRSSSPGGAGRRPGRSGDRVRAARPDGPPGRRRPPEPHIVSLLAREGGKALWSWALAAVGATAPRLKDEQVRPLAARRVAVVGAFIGLCYVGLVLQAARIMLLPDEKLGDQARVQFEQAIRLQGRRGDILARDGSILATTADLLSVHVDPKRLGTNASALAVAEALGPLLDLDSALVLRRITDFSRRDVLLKRNLTPEEAQEISEIAESLYTDADAAKRVVRGAIWTEPEPQRFYPGRNQAASVIGVVGRNGMGAAGIERTLDRVLRGEIHKYVQWRDRKGRRVTTESLSAQGGSDVVLTIERTIQHAAEEAIQEALTVTGAEAAWAVVMDVRTGEILALANRPSDNPNQTSDLDLTAFKNRAALDAYEPGSVFKPFVAAAALEEGLVTPESIIDCEGGGWVVGGKVIHDDHPKGAITVSEVIKYSSNIGAAKLAFKLGAERTLRYLSDLGFARPSGLDLPGETRGVMRSAGAIKPIELATTSYGHGVSVNAIQLTSAIATLGNGGVRMEPMLIREIRGPDGTVLERYEPAEDRRVFSEQTARDSVRMMVTVTEEGGTGTRARVPGYLVAGKTGTAWKHEGAGYSSTKRIGSFVGLVPADRPVLAITITVDSPTIGSSYGGIVAAPAFADIATVALRQMGVPPDPALLAAEDEDKPPALAAETPASSPRDATAADDPSAWTAAELVWTSAGQLRLPDLSGLSLRDALATLQGSGLRISMRGSGQIAAQNPAPGTTLSPGDPLEIILR